MTAKARISAINRFISGCKADGIYNDLQAACVMAGWDGLAGALTPLVGASPTNSGFVDADLDRGNGLTGDGSSKYLDSNRANNADGQDDNHNAVYCSAAASTLSGYLCSASGVNGANQLFPDVSLGTMNMRNRRASGSGSSLDGYESATGLIGHSRSSSSEYGLRVSGEDFTASLASQTPDSANLTAFKFGAAGFNTDATLSFYSIGSATDLALLDLRVSQLMADLRAIEEDGFDADAVAYIRNVETADSAYLETSVKTAINRLVVGLKKDGLWESMKASCLLCGPRTLAGALVPLRGVAPTAVAFTDGDYSRSTGLTGDGSTTYLDSGRANDDDPQNDTHLAAYLTSPTVEASRYLVGVQNSTAPSYNTIGHGLYSRTVDTASGRPALRSPVPIGLTGISRSQTDRYDYVKPPDAVATHVADSVADDLGKTHFVFAYQGANGQPYGVTAATIAFYSIGTSLSLELLDTHISNYVTAIGASV